MQMSLFACCSLAQTSNSNNEDYLSIPHNFLGAMVLLQDLFPHPSVYSRLTAYQAKKFGKNFLEKIEHEFGKSSMNTLDFITQSTECHHAVNSRICDTLRTMNHSIRSSVQISHNLMQSHWIVVVPNNGNLPKHVWSGSPL